MNLAEETRIYQAMLEARRSLRAATAGQFSFADMRSAADNDVAEARESMKVAFTHREFNKIVGRS